MTIIAKSEGGDFRPAPEGQFRSVCCDVVDLGIVTTLWNGREKKQHKIYVSFQIETIDPENNKPFLVSERFTLSLHKKARLRSFLESWRGRPYTDPEIRAGIDVEKMIDACALLQIVHVDRNGTTYANIQSIMRLMKGDKLGVTDYVRSKDRVDQPATSPEPQAMGEYPEGSPLEDEDDDLPF